DANQLLKFRPPKPIRMVQRLMFFFNDNVLMKGLSLKISPADVAKLRAIPKDQGNILVGPHPDVNDGFILVALYRKAKRFPAGMLLGSEEMAKRKWAYPLFKWSGCIPVNRGKPNPEVVDYLTSVISKGSWGGLFPEGSVNWSRNVKAMEHGAVKIAIQAALKAEEAGEGCRPISITPFAHVYFHQDQKGLPAKIDKRLAILEGSSEFWGATQKGLLSDRVMNVAEKALESIAQEHDIVFDPSYNRINPGVASLDRVLIKGAQLRRTLIETLELKYWGAVHGEEEDRRRGNKVKMAILQKISEKPAPEIEAQLRKELRQIIQATQLVPFTPKSNNRLDDMETLAQFVRVVENVLGKASPPFGKREVEVKVLEPIDIRPIAKKYALLTDEEAQREFLTVETEKLRQTIQSGIDGVLKAHKEKHFPQK
ncbi:MAG: 1-acyl-sn-glycerol-3-phosphate acyltransferase, partial [Cyanobacteria bacterium]|nr:1-acyl-sn-glycerol-3-phosphate acyltransferase [Cyanobacteriota bacterium]